MTAPPARLAINAWSGTEAASGATQPGGASWGARRGLPEPQEALPFGPPADPLDWAHPDVGYGVLLPDNDDAALSPADKAAGVDAPQPVRDLLAARPGSVVLRWRPELGNRFVRRHFADGVVQDPVIGLSPFGTAPKHLPRYVVIVGGPDVVPWTVQYALGTRHAVGRLPLTGDALGNYVRALLGGWPGCRLDTRAPLLWTVDHGPSDITSLMRAVITDPLARALTGTLGGLRHLTGVDATHDALLTAATDTSPALIVTSSHGATTPPTDRMRATLGLPVDATHTTVELDALDAAMPPGSIWYSQACCSAGSDATSQYTPLIAEGTDVHRVLSAVANLGSTVAPAALRLLGREHPVRAVLGHVEPTFDWTLSVPETGQLLGCHIVSALSSNLHHGQPLGYLLRDYREGVGQLHVAWFGLHGRLAAGDASVRGALTRLRVAAMDRQSLVLLGDPTATLPPPT